MALILGTTSRDDLGPVHSRSLELSRSSSRRQLRRSARGKAQRSARRIPAIPFRWPQSWQAINHAYHALITGWWRDGNIPGGPAAWDAYAAAVPADIFPGSTATLTGRHWFIWYQRRMLELFGYAAPAFSAHPTYHDYDPAYVERNFPAAPRPGFAQPPAPAITGTNTTDPLNPVVYIPSFGGFIFVYTRAFLARIPTTSPATHPTRYTTPPQQITMVGAPPGSFGTQLRAAVISRPPRKGQKWMVGIASCEMHKAIPSPIAWAALQF